MQKIEQCNKEDYAKIIIGKAMKQTPYEKELIIHLIKENVIPNRKVTYSDAYIEESINLVGQEQTIKLIMEA